MTETARQRLYDNGVGLITGLEGSNGVSLIMVSSPKYQTEPGRIRVGDSDASVKEVFGHQAASYIGDGEKVKKTPALIYNGIFFLLCSNKVEAIWICPKGSESERAIIRSEATQ